MKRRKQFISVILASSLALSIAASVPASEPEEEGSASGSTIKLGLMIAKNGQSLSSDEWEILADIFEDVINQKHEDLSLPFAAEEGLPNLGGAKIEFVTGEQIDTQNAVRVADQLIQEEGVVGLFGHFTSTTTAAAMVSAEKNSVPLLSEGTSMSLLNPGYDYWLRSFGGDDFYVESSLDFIDSVKEEKGGISTIALCSENSDFGTGIASLEKEKAEEHGYTVVENVFYDSSDRDVSSKVRLLKEADADVVMMSSYAADALAFMEEFKAQDYFPRMLLGQRGGFMSSGFGKTLGTDADTVLTTARWADTLENDASRQIARLFQEKTGSALIGDVLVDVWNGVLLAAAINQAGSTESEAIRAAFAEGLSLDPALDPMAADGYIYGGTGENQNHACIIVQYKDVTLETVYPEDKAIADLAYPSVTWSERS